MTNYEFPLQANSPPEGDGDHPALWENPDIPAVREIASGAVEEYECPYPGCHDMIQLIMDDSATEEENMDALVQLIDRNDGTFRCVECDEPLYGFYANGDHV